MAPDWNKLGASFADSSSVLIVDVDCTADGERTCQRMGVRGYPTIKYFMSCLLYTSPSPRDQRGSRMPSSA